MTLAERIKAARKYAGLTQRQLAEAANVEQPLISQLETGKTQKTAHIAQLAKACRVSAIWLSSGEGVMALSAVTADGKIDLMKAQERLQNIEPALQPSRAPQSYPLISWVAAGERAQSPDNFAPGAAEEWLSSTENAGTHGYWLIVKGPSMTSATPPSFPEGTPILVKPEGFDLVSGKFYIARHRSGETTFKQYIYDAGREYLVPLNAKFEPVEMDDTWDVIGRVIDMKAPRGVL